MASGAGIEQIDLARISNRHIQRAYSTNSGKSARSGGIVAFVVAVQTIHGPSLATLAAAPRDDAWRIIVGVNIRSTTSLPVAATDAATGAPTHTTAGAATG